MFTNYKSKFSPLQSIWSILIHFNVIWSTSVHYSPKVQFPLQSIQSIFLHLLKNEEKHVCVDSIINYFSIINYN